MRPFGGTVFGVLADRFGRRRALLLSIWGMLIATCSQGLLPSRSSIGSSAAAALCLLRIVQGACAGGEVGALSVYLAESAEPGCHGAAVALISATGNLAFFVASGVVGGLRMSLGEADMADWGWRIPFLLALPPGLVSALLRNRVPETRAFQQESAPGAWQTNEAAAVSADVDSLGSTATYGSTALLSSHAKGARKGVGLLGTAAALRAQVLVALIAPAGIATLWYMIVFAASASQDALWANAGAQIIALAFNPIGAVFTDRFGIARQQLVANALIAILAPVAYRAAANANMAIQARIVCVSLGLGALQGFAGATVYLNVVDLFPAHVRTSLSGFCYNASLAVFGGAAPLVAEGLAADRRWVLLLVAGVFGVVGCASSVDRHLLRV